MCIKNNYIGLTCQNKAYLVDYKQFDDPVPFIIKHQYYTVFLTWDYIILKSVIIFLISIITVIYIYIYIQ